jgi:hypothetical protein
VVEYGVAERTRRQTSEPIAETQYYPAVIKVHCELTLEQAAVMFFALKSYRNVLMIKMSANSMTDDEKQAVKHDIFTIDRLKGMFE